MRGRALGERRPTIGTPCTVDEPGLAEPGADLRTSARRRSGAGLGAPPRLDAEPRGACLRAGSLGTPASHPAFQAPGAPGALGDRGARHRGARRSGTFTERTWAAAAADCSWRSTRAWTCPTNVSDLRRGTPAHEDLDQVDAGRAQSACRAPQAPPLGSTQRRSEPGRRTGRTLVVVDGRWSSPRPTSRHGSEATCLDLDAHECLRARFQRQQVDLGGVGRDAPAAYTPPS